MLMLLLQIGVITGPLEARTGSAKEIPPSLIGCSSFKIQANFCTTNVVDRPAQARHILQNFAACPQQGLAHLPHVRLNSQGIL